MVGGFVVIPNSTLEDDDNLELLATVIDYLGQAIGKAVDKAAVYGDGDKKPVGFVHRLSLSAKPGWWGSQQADFTDLHTSNVIKLDLYEKDGVAFFRPLIAALGKAKPNYSNGQLVWVMNRTTHMGPHGPRHELEQRRDAARRHGRHHARYRRHHRRA